MRAYKKFFDEKIRELAAFERVLDAGGATPFQKELAPYKKLFENTQFETLDINKLCKPTIVGDIHNIPLREGSVDGVICFTVLEHVRDPTKAVQELHRVLKKGGKALVYVPAIHPYHAKTGPGAYGDYWRFMPEGLQELFKPFKKIEIRKAGGFFETITKLFPFTRITEPIAYIFDQLFRTRKKSITFGYYIYAEK